LYDTSLGVIDKNTIINDKPLKIFIAPAIIISRNGQAGCVQFVNEGIFTINDHAYVLSVKDEYNEFINLKWFGYICEEYTKNFVSSKDSNGTFCKELFMLSSILVPKVSEQLQFVETYENLLKVYDSINGLLKNIHSIIT
jgi:hypothetical protein